MNTKTPQYLSVEQCVDRIIETFGNDIRIGMPLGLGKPTLLINALYQRAKNNSALKLTVFTALSLEKPAWSSDLQQRLLEPFVNRVWEGVPDLDYVVDLRNNAIPDNVSIQEMFFKAGAYKNNPKMQQDYINSNYTHSVRDADINNNCIWAQTIATRESSDGTQYSTSSNADCTLETASLYEKHRTDGNKKLLIGMVNTHLPFMYGDAVVSPELFDIIIDEPELSHPLFSTPRLSVNDSDYLIGLNVSTLIKDHGTLQIGIGALGDAIAYGLRLRHTKNERYREIIASTAVKDRYQTLINQVGGLSEFNKGLYGATEMFVDGFLHLYKDGIIKRKVYHHLGLQKLINEGDVSSKIPQDILEKMLLQETIAPYLTEKEFVKLQNHGVFREDIHYEDGNIIDGEKRYSPLLIDAENLAAISQNCLGSTLKNGVLLTAGFFIGPNDFYESLRKMPESERQQFEMTGVEVANQLYGDEKLRTEERINGRFCNSGMKATLLGSIVSDGMEDGAVISGVGGQYNFVSMAHALQDGRLIMMIKSTRTEGNATLSNIVYSYGHCTIPRHMRDIIVTEYGIADIRGKSDSGIIKEMLNIADSRFQQELLCEAKASHKIADDYQIPDEYCNNTPESIREQLAPYKNEGYFPPFPNGSDFDQAELVVASALKVLSANAATTKAAEFPEMMKALPDYTPKALKPIFSRMGLASPKTKQEIGSQKTLLLAFQLAGYL